MKKSFPKPTDAELGILKVIWEKGEATVREVNEKFTEKREVGYTTTLKLMQIMISKKLLTREEKGRTHVYKASIKETDIQKELVDRLLETAFGGSAKTLVLQALGNKNTSKEELKEIKELLNKMENENGSNE